MNAKRISSTVVTAFALAILGFQVKADDLPNKFSATFSGFQEVGALNAETGAVLSNGTGHLSLNVDRGNRVISFVLTFSGLSAPVTQSHIHFGKRHVPGGVIVFFCTNLNNGPAGTQLCPANGGTVTGSITGSNVVGPAAQNIPAGDFDGLLAAIQSDTAYGNIHTTKFPAGEIRGQVLPSERED
jgi:hypothetical protein